MILIPAMLWQVEVGAFFAQEYSVLASICEALLVVMSLTLLVSTIFSDPGIMPRQKEYKEHYDAKTKTFRTKQPPRYQDIILHGYPFKLKFCSTCNIYRPPRCTHCSVCDNCVERFDHHCPWVGNCIGKRNYWLFYSFVATTGVLTLFTLLASIIHLSVVCNEIMDNAETDM